MVIIKENLMQNLYLKNLNNTDPIENYLNQLEKYDKKIEELSTEKLTLFSEITNNENNEKHINLLNNIKTKENQIKQTKEKHKTLTITLLKYFLNELEQLKTFDQNDYKNIEVIRNYLRDFRLDREQYVQIKELRYMNNNIKNIKT
jgi:hypothetical protein